ncbi:hypothetical protein FNV43_RR24328 [Rhamnella rubrinervis]|uniref:Uncharacterized protein n=1 Tax=Rhamnella rubrinervis TaxID=2594499 RepID=A0A8K0GQ51_9ROSA|nr:hypothetical protein FNV43_RR24328 [Rhamnella rubrinervis]
MASIAISASLQILCSSSNHATKRKQPQTVGAQSLGIKQDTTHVLTQDVEGQQNFNIAEQKKSGVHNDRPDHNAANNKSKHGLDEELSVMKFTDERWKNGTWDLNMFVKHGKMDWDGVILAGRAAMVGFFMAYIVDGLTGLDVVGQTGNLICKAGLFVTVTDIVLFKRTQDFDNLRKLADEATLYDKQWQASWQDRHAGNDISEQTGPTF